ncbi:unnamed protein product [Fraxinus pennsylvanica]|uniref:AAA+ ATPase domain-containing protein n=1 Tax=Fraxinus pennsylvanica TaxID=56036 RepID=A0AAD1ZAD3_9LAMI|nr:unnamed protein product [Fraxinus pennsylvanica]
MEALIVEAIVRPFADKIIEELRTKISRQFKYLYRYDKIIEELRTKVRDLEKQRNDVEEAKKYALVIIPEVEVDVWPKNVDDLKKKVDEVLHRTTNSEIRCQCLGCPNIFTRYSLSKDATKMITEIDELVKVKFEMVGKRAHHGSEDLKTRVSTKKKIIRALEDTDNSIVGICGLPGVGKTTMAKEVETQVRKDKLFDEVAWVTVSKDTEIKIIQEKLAEALGLKIEQKTNEVERASRLNEELFKKRKKRILVIFDDVWTGIDLENLGFSSSSHREGLKILLTSRFEEVCRGMGALTNIKVEVLDSDEAFAFFKNISKISNDDTQLLAIAKQVAEECKGLPLALEVVGKTLINSGLYAWKDALYQLRNSRLEDKVYSSIEWSYKYLKSDEHRSLLLLCSLFPEDDSIPIERLVRYAWGLKLFKSTKKLSQTRDRARTISDNLKSCHLLLPGDEEEEVILHDVIRDFCLSIASKGEHWYTVKHDLVTEWPEHDADEYESYSAIFLTFQGAIRLPSRFRCGNLKLLRMQSLWGAGVVNIPENFFDDMQELIVIDIDGLLIRSPIQLSKGLRTLHLDYCVLGIGMSFFGSLKNLEILTLLGSVLSVDFSRDEVVEHSNIKLLDLRFSKGPCPLPPGFLLGMKKLEELYLGDYFNINGEKEHIIQEVSSLKALNNLQINTDDTRFLMQLFQGCSEEVENFQINQDRQFLREYSVGNFLYSPEHSRRDLALDNIDPNMLSEPGMKSLMRKSEQLSLSVKGWNNPVIELAEDGFINLKSLKLNLLDSEYLIDNAGSIPSDIFRNLESLSLTRMSRLKEMCNANFPRMEHVTRGVSEGLFCNLKNFNARDCDKMKRMFSQSVAKGMVNLEELTIRLCPSLEVVSVETHESEITEPLSFPKLKVVRLEDLKSFVSFRSQPNAVGLRQTLLNQVTLPKVKELYIRRLGSIEKILSMEETPSGSLNRLQFMVVDNCDKLVNIAQSNSIKLLKNLETLQVKGGRALNVIFDFEGLNVNNDNEEEISILGQLGGLELYRGDCLVHITRMVPKGIRVFQNLQQLEVKNCGRLRYLFPSSMINSFVCLETLAVCCGEIEEIFGREEGEGEGGMASNIAFRKLRRLVLTDLKSFVIFRSQPNAVGLRQTLLNQVTLPNVSELYIRRLGSIEKILSMEETPSGSLNRLRFMLVDNCDKLVNIAQSNSIKLLKNLLILKVMGGRALNVIFDFEGLNVNNDNEEEISILGQLGGLELYRGDCLVHITRMVPKGIRVFQNLKLLTVVTCDKLRYLFPASMISSFVCLKTLSVRSCGEIEEIFGREEEEEGGMASKIVFPELKSIELIGLPRFKMFCSHTYELVFPSLDLLKIQDCPVMTKFCSGQLNAPKLKGVQTENDEVLTFPISLDCNAGSVHNSPSSSDCE